ncbi:hypothetical protein Taro_008989 [Colocasia esculenta]|uniref:Uncharacterized protein n=1 Tax=Colocasia esculenta TaxID=4460 RepID=A0A843TYV8_COLES|nr:hypothetical protein [Colocasia esculenta]
MAMAVHESPDMAKLWPVRKRLRRDSSPPSPPPNNTATTASTSAGVPFRRYFETSLLTQTYLVEFRVQDKWHQHAAAADSARPAAGGVNGVAGDDDGKRVRVVFSGAKARPRARRRRSLAQITNSIACPIQQYPCERRIIETGKTRVGAEEKAAALEPRLVAVPVVEAPSCHDVQATAAVDARWIVQRLPPPSELPASPVNATLEAELRVLFDQMVRSGELVFRFCRGPVPGSEHIECSDVLTAWVFRLLNEGAGDKVWQEQIERLVYKVLFEYIMKVHSGVTCDNGGRIAGPVGAGELMNAHGKMSEEPLLDMLKWLKGVAMDPLEPRRLPTLQDQGWNKWQNVNISSERSLTSPNCLNLNECPGQDNDIYCQQMVLCSREALFVKIKDILPTEDFPYHLKKQKIHQYLSETSRPAVLISPDNMGSSSFEESESADSSTSIHGMPMQPRRRLARPLALLKFNQCHRKRVPIGSDFQADVPQWKGPCNGRPLSGGNKDPSDSRWLGTRIWPIECDFQEVCQETIGKGRSTSCLCPYPRSVSCVRYHINAGKVQLRRKLGQAFNSLGLNEMGEEVSDSWTSDEERIFSALVKLNPLSEYKSFWEPALKLLGSKSRQKIVSYYFNVFVPRRIGIQTRFLCGDADSDDDEINVDDFEDLYPRASCEWYHPVSVFLTVNQLLADASCLPSGQRPPRSSVLLFRLTILQNDGLILRLYMQSFTPETI